MGNELTEPRVARAVHRFAAAHGATVVVSASMPMRDLEWFAEAMPEPPRVLSNRGANGIDGVVSTSFGVAAAGDRTVALLGDLAFLHDVSGLVNLAPLPCTFVVPDNRGGGIFSFLPQAEAVDAARFEELFGTPPTSDLAAVGTRLRTPRARGGHAGRARGGTGGSTTGPRPRARARSGSQCGGSRGTQRSRPPHPGLRVSGRSAQR